MNRLAALLLAYFFLVISLIGVILPGLPTVPFLLLAAWFSAKGSDRLHRWLYAHPHFGKLLIDWEQQGAISRSSKVIAFLLLTLSWIIMYQSIGNIWLLTGMAVLFIAIMAFLISRPEPQ
ncbi:MAG: YbaN family protein [Gammaproteobacteria bacterium]